LFQNQKQPQKNSGGFHVIFALLCDLTLTFMAMKSFLELASIKILLAVLVIGAASYLNFKSTDISVRPSDGYDEQMWTGASIASYHMFFKNYENPSWYPERWFLGYSQKYRYNPQAMPASQLQWFDDAMWTFGWKAPNIAKYIMGFGVVAFSDTIIDPQGYFYRYTEDKAKNKWPGNYAPASFVEQARKVNAILNIMTIAVVMLVGYYFIGFYSGLFAGLFLTFNPTFTLINTAAGVDSAASLFSTVAVIALLILVKRMYKAGIDRKFYLSAALLGLSFAFAVGSKLSGAIVGFIIALVYLLMAYNWLNPYKPKLPVEKKPKDTILKTGLNFNKLLISGLIVTFITFSVFIYSNPVLYHKPTLKMKMIRESVKEFFDIRAQALKTEDINKSGWKSFVLVVKRNFVKTEESYYGTLGTWIPFKFNPLDLILLATGIYWLWKKAKDDWQSPQRVNDSAVLLISFALFLYGVVSFIWVDWPRYHTPIFPIVAMISGYGLIKSLQVLAKNLIPD
jgi:hypothetical protein